MHIKEETDYVISRHMKLFPGILFYNQVY